MTTWRWDPNWERTLMAVPEVYDIVDDAGAVVERGAVARAPVSEFVSDDDPPGRLKASVGRTGGRDTDGPYIDIGAGADYALDVELGTRPHIIESHGPWPLRNRRTGQVFGRRVEHPGTEPQPFLRPALDDIAGQTF